MTEQCTITAPTLSADQLLDRAPAGELEVRDVIDTLMACVHRENADSPARPYLGCEVALRFLSSSHQASGLVQSGGPPAFRRYLLQPHKQALATWSEYRAMGEPIIIERKNHPWEAYQQLEVRASSDDDWSTLRWLLIKEGGAWRVDGDYSAEPDELDVGVLSEELQEVANEAPLDIEMQRRLFAEFDDDGSGAIDAEEIAACVKRLGMGITNAELSALVAEVDTDGSGEIEFDEFSALLGRANAGCAQGDFAAILSRSATTESPREVIELVMSGMRHPDEPYKHYGAARAVRYCSPTNRASGLSPEAFAAYLQEPWYRVLRDWEQMEIDDEEDIDTSTNVAQVDVLLRQDESDSPSVVNFQLSRHNARWLIDSIQVTE